MKNFILRSISFIRGIIVGASIIYGVISYGYFKMVHEEATPSYRATCYYKPRPNYHFSSYADDDKE